MSTKTINLKDTLITQTPDYQLKQMLARILVPIKEEHTPRDACRTTKTPGFGLRRDSSGMGGAATPVTTAASAVASTVSSATVSPASATAAVAATIAINAALAKRLNVLLLFLLTPLSAVDPGRG